MNCAESHDVAEPEDGGVAGPSGLPTGAGAAVGESGGLGGGTAKKLWDCRDNSKTLPSEGLGTVTRM